MERAVIYCRTNSASQVSIANQEKSCRKFAETNNLSVDGVYIDKGEVGSATELRELQRLLGYTIVARNRPSAIIVARLDRLTRKLSDYVQLHTCLQNLGIKIISVDTSEQYEDNAIGRLQCIMKVALTQYDQDLRSERIKQGLRRKKGNSKN